MFKCLKFKFPNVQILKRFNVQTFKCSNVQIFNVPIVHVPMFQCSNVQKFRYSDVRCTDGIIFKCPNIHMSKMLIFCWSVHLEFFRSFLFGFSWKFWKVGFCQDRWLVTSVESKSFHKNQRPPSFYTHVKNVMMKVWYICSNLLNTFTFLCNPTFVIVIPTKSQHPLTFLSGK